jgi:glycosyltransferase involved in cell wall biosynthesis
MTTSCKKILLFGYLPPPYFGPSVTYQGLMRSEFARHFDVRFINLTVFEDIGEVEQFRFYKLVRLVGIFCRALGDLLARRFDFCCYPPAFNRNAFLKDSLLLLLVRCFRVPVVIYSHSNNLPDFYESSMWWLRRLIDWTIGGANAVIVLGERLRSPYFKYVPNSRVLVVPHGLEPVQLPARSHRDDRLTVLFLSHLLREKGVFVLLGAVSKVVARRPDAQFVFAGAWMNNRERLEAQDFIHDNEIEGHVQFRGIVTGEAKWRLLVDADIFAFPTFYKHECHPSVLLEALHAGLPVVTTRRGAIPEIIEEGVNGLLVEEQDTASLAEKILQLGNDPALRQIMADANRRKFHELYTLEQYGQRMIAAFEKLSVGDQSA